MKLNFFRKNSLKYVILNLMMSQIVVETMPYAYCDWQNNGFPRYP